MHQLILTVSQNILVNHLNEHSRQSMYSKCPPPACTHDLRRSCLWSIAAAMMSWSKSNEICIKLFCCNMYLVSNLAVWLQQINKLYLLTYIVCTEPKIEEIMQLGTICRSGRHAFWCEQLSRPG